MLLKQPISPGAGFCSFSTFKLTLHRGFSSFSTFLLQLLALSNLQSRRAWIDSKQLPLERLVRFNNNPSVSIWTNIHRRQSLTNQTSDENGLEMFTQPQCKWFLNVLIQFHTFIRSLMTLKG